MNKAVFTIPMGTPFLDAIVAGIQSRVEHDPNVMSEATVLLPTRRACRNLRRSFLRFSKENSIILPKILPLGDLEVDELYLRPEENNWANVGNFAVTIPQSISIVRRQLLLANLILRQNSAIARESGPMYIDQAMKLADDLARLLDQIQTQEISLNSFNKIVPETLAKHWQETLKFLSILTHHWPKILKEQNAIDPAERRRILTDALGDHWKKFPPRSLTIAAGSTGSIPATARLLSVIAGLPNGLVVLPGLDLEMSDKTWGAIEPTHPQYSMSKLLRTMGVNRHEVIMWDSPSVVEGNVQRNLLLSKALQPLENWARGDLSMNLDEKINLQKVVCENPEEEARSVALAIRGELEHPQREIAIVTTDRKLARRVTAELTRWNIIVDDSAGIPLSDTLVGTFLLLTAEFIAKQFKPISLLAALKHPHSACGLKAKEFRKDVRDLEVSVFRGRRNILGFNDLIGAVRNKGLPSNILNAVIKWLEPLAIVSEKFSKEINKQNSSLKEILYAHIAFAEHLASDNKLHGSEKLWSGQDGEAAAIWLKEILQESEASPTFDGSRYPSFLSELLSKVNVHFNRFTHSRVHIWDPLEARLQNADLMIIAGLNEGSWPTDSSSDLWLSIEMRKKIGLQSPEFRVGLSAHDFVQFASSNKVILTRTSNVDGEPTTPSRWLVKLEAILNTNSFSIAGQKWKEWQKELDGPTDVVIPKPPRPCPPVSSRPNHVTISDIETLVRDPYAFYSRRILRLKALEDIDTKPNYSERGRLIHSAVDSFLDKISNKSDSSNFLQTFLKCGEEAFRDLKNHPLIFTFWWPQFERLAEWFVINEQERNKFGSLVGKEVEGLMTFDGKTKEFTVSGRADRIEQFYEGGLSIIDYKTGQSAPHPIEVETGFAPQLLIEAVMATKGHFQNIDSEEVVELSYWLLHGRDDGGAIKSAINKKYDQAQIKNLITETEIGISKLMNFYDNSSMPYLSNPRAQYEARFSDYDHLARSQEWAGGFGMDISGE